MPSLMQSSIERAVEGTRPFTAARNRALASVRWVLATADGRFVAVDGQAQVRLVSESAKAAIYDGRDNEELKRPFFEALVGVPLTVVLLDQ